MATDNRKGTLAPDASKRQPTPDEQAGLEWWASLEEPRRQRWTVEYGADIAAAWHAAKIRNAEICFGQIASLAKAIDREHFFFSEAALENSEATGLLLSRARDAMLQIGWLADLGTKQIVGRTNIFGQESPADWMAVPIFDRDIERFVDRAADKRWQSRA